MSRLLLSAALIGTSALAVGLPDGGEGSPRPVLTRATAPLAHSNSHDGRAVLAVAGMKPGDRHSGEVTIRNEGGAGDLALGVRAEGRLAQRLRLTVGEGGGDAMVDAPLARAPACTALGAVRAGVSRTYRFTVAFERGDDDDAYAGATARADFAWVDRCSPAPATPLALGDTRLAVDPGPYRFARRTGTSTVAVHCVASAAGRCKGRLELERRKPGQGRGIAMAVGRIDIPAGKRKRITLKLNSRARRRITGTGTVAVRAYVTANDATGRTHRAAWRDRLTYRPRR